ncbi:MAG: hypothetical protein LUC33_00910 [Prevotellaceae bacterium]|nr:hypothetical protein [Prevotellaceae bacterium]
MASCDVLISQEITRNCSDSYLKGLEQIGWAFNRSEIDFDKIEFRSENELSALPLVSGAKAYKIYQAGNKPFNGLQTEIAAGDIAATATNTVQLIVLDDSPELSAKFIDPLMNGGELVFVAESKYKGLKNDNAGGPAFKIYGYYQGLTIDSATQDKYSDDSLGGWVISLIEENVPKSALYLNAGSYGATKALLEAALTAA